MKRLEFIVLFLLMANATFAINLDADTDFLYGYLPGTYILIGKAPDSNVTYYGTVEFIKEESGLKVIRSISGKIVTGEGRIEYATADKTQVLRVRFIENKKQYEATYLIGSDLDNYGRLTGFLYEKEGKTKLPGLEALFSDHVLKK
jgi:hypothetical protein